MAGRTLLLISARADATARGSIAAGTWPRKDFLALADALNADVIDYDTIEQARLMRAASRLFGAPVTQALLAFRQRHRYDQIFCDGEHIGLPLALLLRLSRRRPRHVLLGHLLDTPAKRAVFRLLRPVAGFDAALLHATRQREVALTRLAIPAAKLVLLPYQVDPTFWSTPPAASPEAMICSAGLEYRDYPTLIAAVAGLPLRVVIAAASHWSRHRDDTAERELPPNVAVTSLDYVALRACYARARFVVVPLRDVENQAGVTVILEAMAMGKAVIVTATRGQSDVVRGRLCTAAGPAATLQGGPAAFGLTGPLAEAETGLYVPVGDVAALRCAISYLNEHPDEAERMGAAGRRLVEEVMNLDLFVGRIAAIIRGTPAGSADTRVHRQTSRESLQPAGPGGAEA